MEKSSKREQSSRTTLTDGIIVTAAAATLAGLMYVAYYTVRGKKNPSSSSDTERAKKHRALIPSKLLNKYHLGELLGEGTYACVFCAGLKNDETSSLMGYAIKVIPRSILVQGHVHNFDPEFLESELAILRRCQHKNILSLVDSQWTKDALVFVTERAFGGVLFDKILEIDHYDEQVAKDIFRQLVEAVRYLHDEAAVIHRDLKPENILLMETGDKCTSVRICDFGVSKMWTSSSQTVPHGSSATVQKKRSTQLRQASFKKKSLRTTTVTGTPGYQAPEMMDGGTSYGTEVDIWSLGIILHAMLCGALPADFGTPKFYDTVWNHVSIDAKDLITAMLQEDPNDRPSAAKLLKSKWLNGGIGSTKKNPKELWKLVQSKLRVESEKSKLKS